MSLAFFFYFSASPFGLANSNSFTMAMPDGFVLVVKVCTLLTALHLEVSVFLTPVISGFGGIRFPHVKGFDSLSFKDFLISPIIFVYNLGAGPRVPVLLKVLNLGFRSYNSGQLAKKLLYVSR